VRAGFPQAWAALSVKRSAAFDDDRAATFVGRAFRPDASLRKLTYVHVAGA
jgi:hypothetical protein